MKIANRTTSNNQDKRLLESLEHIGLEIKQLENVVNLIYKNIFLPAFKLLDLLWKDGYSCMELEDMDIIIHWIEQYSNIDI